MKTKLTMTVVLVASLILLLGITAGASAQSSSAKKAIVVASFGTTYNDALKANIESVEEAIAANFPDYELRRAFTSKIVMKRLGERGIKVDNLEESLLKLKKEGYREVVIQTTLLTAGEEYDKKIMAVVRKFQQDGSFDKLVVGRPLMYNKASGNQADDYTALAEALKAQMPIMQMKDKVVIFMGHGSPNQPNPAYGILEQQLQKAGLHALVGVVEETDHPNFEDVLKSLSQKPYKRIILMPLMLVSGDHANNDMAGDEDDSWKSRLIKKGYQVETYLQGLGANTAVQNLYVEHTRDAILSK